jgi:hypothetical protein
MKMSRTRWSAFACVAVTLTLSGAAAGFATGRVFQVQSGDRADIHVRGAVWSCTSTRGEYVTCQGGDAFPFVELGGNSWPCHCVSVKVFTLRDPQGGHIIRTYEKGRPVYIFRAL